MSKFNLVPINEKSFYNKAVVSVEDNIATLVSYTTKVATYNIATKKLFINGWYSSNTARHINAFLSHYGLSTMSKKELLSNA